MADAGFKRKLAAILSADVEGYSRLMDDDEEATVRTLTAYRTAIGRPCSTIPWPCCRHPGG
jgi:adenylate cyclase